jgi:hypothetical protein
MMKTEQDYGTGNIKLSLGKKLSILAPYVRTKFIDQIKGVWFIVLYLLLFQTLVLRLPIVYSLMISLGLAIVILGLMFFLEGVLLGLMPFSETIGSLLPKKSKLPVILMFGFIVGMGATFAEPAIGALKAAGSNVLPDKAPLLFSLLNDFSGQLVFCVGAGVGMAVLISLLRFLYGWRLRTVIIPSLVFTMALTLWAHFNGVLQSIIGLAWDCGGITTGPVTVPIVLALGIGVCRVAGSGDSSSAGFGTVSMASMLPVLAVLSLGVYHFYKDDYYGRPNYGNKIVASAVVESPSKETGAAKAYHLKGFSQADIEEFQKTGELPGKYAVGYEGGTPELKDGKIRLANATIVFTKTSTSSVNRKDIKRWDASSHLMEMLRSAALASLQAIIPLVLFLLITIKLVLREKLPQADEIAVGIIFALIGMTLFSLGILLGLTPLGNQVGQNTVAAFTSVVPWGMEGIHGPLYGAGFLGKMVAILFGFLLGYGATLAEPALNAVGVTVEKITVGAFKKILLMQTVAIGVGVGIALGVAKLSYNVPITYLLLPLYVICVILTYLSEEDICNFAWDSGGVTTGPMTVPLVLAMGLGIGSNIPGVIEGFGILGIASVTPVIAVLMVGIIVRKSGGQQMESTGAVEGASHD